MRIGIVSIPVSNQEKAKAWYRDALGFEVRAENPMGDGMTWIEMGPVGGETSITLVRWFDRFPAGAQTGLVLVSDDIDADHAALRGRGLEISEIEGADWGRYALFSDPDGNGWVLSQAGG